MAKATWTDERLADLQGLIADGLSATRIAAAMGNGITRNAVIGAAARRGWQLGGSPQHGETRRQASRLLAKRINAAKPKRPAPQPRPVAFPPPEPSPAPPSLKLALADLKPSSCRWMEGEGYEATYCGHRHFGQSSFCEAHARLAYSPEGFERTARKAMAA